MLASLITGFGGKPKPPGAFFPSLADTSRRMDADAIYRKLLHIRTMFAKE